MVIVKSLIVFCNGSKAILIVLNMYIPLLRVDFISKSCDNTKETQQKEE